MIQTRNRHVTTILRFVALMTIAAISATNTTSASFAADNVLTKASLTVSPPSTEIDVAPGQEYKHVIKLTNSSDADRSVEALAQNFQAGGEEGQPDVTEELGPYSLSQWIEISPKQARIAQGATQEFTIKIKIPQQATPGGHFGAIVFSPTSDPSGGQVSVRAQITSLILLKVPGDANEAASIASLNICQPEKKAEGSRCDKSSSFLKKHSQVMFSTRVQNDGNVQLKPTGSLTITNVLGSKTFEDKFNPSEKDGVKISSKNVLPSSVRRFDITWPKGFHFGYYKVQLALTYGTNNEPIRTSKSFWLIPFIPTLIVLGTFALGFLLLWLPRKRFRRAMKALMSSN